MRRITALILSILLFVGVLPSVHLYGATSSLKEESKLGFQELSIEIKDNKGMVIQKPQGIKEDKGQLKLMEGPLVDEVAMKWKLGDETAPRHGTYTLSYFVEGGDEKVSKPYEIIAEYKRGESNKLQVQMQLKDEKGDLVDTLYTMYKPPYTSTSIEKNVEGDTFTGALDLEPNAIVKSKELVVAIGELSRLTMFVKGDEIFVSATGIKKDYITPFELQYKGAVEGIKPEADGFNAFKGTQDFQILPTHLTVEEGVLVNKELALPSQTLVDLDKVIAEGEKGVEPGSRPGIVVTLSKPRTLTRSDKLSFVPIDKITEAADQEAQQAEIYLEELLGKGADVGNRKQIKVRFDLEDQAPLVDAATGKQKGKVKANGNRFEIYFTKDIAEIGFEQPGREDYLFEWPHLQQGMLINGEVAFAGHLFGDENKTLEFKPDKIGYTYVHYAVQRLTEDDISFKVEPYNIRGPVTYVLSKQASFGEKWHMLDVRHYADKPQNEMITLTTKMGVDENYKISMSTGSDKGEFESQIVNYNGENDLVPPPYSEIMGVENVYVIPDDFKMENITTADISAVGLDIEWSAPDQDKLKNYIGKGGGIFYELYLSDNPDQVGKPIKVFKVIWEDNKPHISTYKGTVNGDVVYSPTRNSFSAKGVVLKDKSAPANQWEVLDIPKYEGRAKYPLQSEIKQGDEATYIVPNTYYLTVRPVYEKPDQGEDNPPKLAPSKYSNPKSLALDIIRRVIPTPEVIRSEALKDDKGQCVQGLYFNPVDLTNYVKYMLNPLGIKLHEKATEDAKYTYYRHYEIYLYQTKVEGKIDPLEPVHKVLEVSGEKDEKGTFNVQLEDKHTQFMREDKGAIKIEYTSERNSLDGDKNLHDILLKGLEPNAPYYVQIRTRIDLYKEGKPLNKSVHSVMSKIHPFTTETKPIPPTTDEQVPPAPEKFFIDAQPNNTTVKLGWEESSFALSHPDTTYYELIRADGVDLETEHTSRLLDLETVVDKNSKYKGFHTKDDYIQSYIGGKWGEHVPKQGSQFLRLEENTLLPNMIYYYYMRTVYEVKGEKVYSEWIMLPVTTSPVQKPIGLQVEPQSAFKYDGQHETVISFLAPIPQGSKVPEDFSFDIAVKGEKDEDYRLDYSAKLIQEEVSSKEYRRFVYKITGLSHGTRYDIKVRVVDKTGFESATSLYSDKVVARTDFSEEDQDEENAYNKYLEQYEKEAEKLKRNPYWKVESGKYEEIYKYKGSYIQSELASFKTYPLVTQGTGKSVYYYVPSTFFTEAQKANTLVTIQLEDYTATLRPGLLKENEEIQEAQERVKKGKYKDYYVGIQFSLMGLEGKISGDYVISPEILMDLEVVYSNKQELILEDDIMDSLNKLIDEGRKDVVDDLEKSIVNGKIEEAKLASIIEKTLNWVVREHEEKVSKLMKKAVEKEVEIYEIQTPIYLEAVLDAYEANAYYRAGSRWEQVYTYNVGGKLAVEMNKLGSYVFTGSRGTTELVPDVPGGSNLVSQYTLTDFFDIERGLDQTVTKEKLYGAVARVLGARRGTDYVLYLKDRGIKLIIPNTLYQPVRQDEAIYIVMQGYEKMYYKNVNMIQITNKLRVSNIAAFQPQYRPYVYAAVELGVVTPENNKVLPSKYMTAKEVIRMLAKIAPK